MTGAAEKTVSLPSGRQVVIRKPGVWAMYEILNTLPALPTDGTEPAEGSSADNLRAMANLVVACTKDPPLSLEAGSPGPGRTFIDDALDATDFFALYAEVEAFSGWREATERVRNLAATGGP